MTETQVPQPIEWDQVRVGDVIRAERDWIKIHGRVNGIASTLVLTVVGISNQLLLGPMELWSLTLISRPAPEREPGSLWWHEASKTGWVATDSKGYPYHRAFKGEHGGGITWLNPEPDDDFIAALVPYPPEPARRRLCSVCLNCHRKISKSGKHWYHDHHNYIRCDGYPLAQLSKQPVATPKATS